MSEIENNQHCDAYDIARIIAAETGDILKIGDPPGSFYPKLAKAMRQMHEQLEVIRRGVVDG